MKELKVFEAWADNIVEAQTQFKQPTRMGTPMQAKADRPLPRNVDIQYKAQRAHPELSPEQALALYMSDELVDKEKMDYSQNKLINTVKRDNEKLRRTIDELGSELTDHEKHAAQTDQEVARLKDLSAKLKPAGEITKQAAMASSDQIEKMLKDVEELRLKPGMTPDKQKELEQKINDIKSGGLTSDEVKNINKTIDVLTVKQDIDDAMFDKVMDRLDDTQAKLDSKEKRFQKSIRKNAEKIGSWGNKFKELDEKLKEIESRADEKLAVIDEKTERADAALQRIMDLMYDTNPDELINPSVNALDNLDDKDEVFAQMGTPGGTTLPPMPDAMAQPEEPTSVATQEPEPADMSGEVPQMQLPLQEPPLPDFTQPGNVDDAGELASHEPSQQALGDILDRFKTNEDEVMDEQIEMIEPTGPSPEERFNKYVDRLVYRYKYYYPVDMQYWSEGQIKAAIARTAKLDLLSYGKRVNEEVIQKYLYTIHNYLRRSTKPALSTIMPGIEIPDRPRPIPTKLTQTDVSESLVNDFARGLDKLTGGY